ncbi:DUF4193 family protein [Kocuria sp. KH4]
MAPGPAVIDAEDFDTAEGIDLAGANLAREELTVAAIPEQNVEFTCRICFLVRHRFQLVRTSAGTSYCGDCAG